MVKQTWIAWCFAVIFILTLSLSAWGRTWVMVATPHDLGVWPSMTLIDGVIPLLSNFYEIHEWNSSGWDRWEGYSEYLAGDGQSTVVTNIRAVKFAADGRFYSVSYPYPSIPLWLSDTGEWQPVGPEFPGPFTWSVCSADPDGWVYMASANLLGMTHGSDWQIMPASLNNIWDIAVSKYGDVAVSGYVGGATIGVAWFDFKAGAWRTRSLGTAPFSRRVAIEFDQLGNLGVAYVDGADELHYAYLDFDKDFWTDDLVVRSVGGTSRGAALAFDFCNQPVLAAGRTLAFDPPLMISGTVELSDYSAGPRGVPVTVEFHRTDVPAPVWTYASLLHGDGKFYVPNAVEPGVYDVAVKASHWLRKNATGIIMPTGSIDLGLFQLINGDCDDNNAVDTTDLSIVLSAMDTAPGDPLYNPLADLDGTLEIDSTDLSIVLTNLGQVGDPYVTFNISGKVSLLDYVGNVTQVPVRVELRRNNRVIRSELLGLDDNGNYILPDVPVGIYELAFKASHWLQRTLAGVSVVWDVPNLNVTLTNGDSDGDNEITTSDLANVLFAMDAVPGDLNWLPEADLDGDEEVTTSDLATVLLNMDLYGAP